MSALVEAWFGKGFAELHPRLQRLHRDGGSLGGTVEVSFGRGAAGVVGRRLASWMGVPTTPGPHHLQVDIHSDAEILHWGRTFDRAAKFNSKFRPVGTYPSGHWLEQSGKMTLALGVEVRDGSWHWQHRSTTLFGITVPSAIFPRTVASKEIEGNLYRFSVEVRAAFLGKLLEYSGTLKLVSPAEEKSLGMSAAPMVHR